MITVMCSAANRNCSMLSTAQAGVLQRFGSCCLCPVVRRCAVLLFDPQSWRLDPASLEAVASQVVLALPRSLPRAALAWYVVEAIRTGSLPGGSSTPGLAAGWAGRPLFFFYLFSFAFMQVARQFLLGVPPQADQILAGSARLVRAAHFSARLVAQRPSHALGGSLTIALLLVYLVVFISGVWGLWSQQRLHAQPAPGDPRRDDLFGQIPSNCRASCSTRRNCSSWRPAGRQPEHPQEALPILEKSLGRVRASLAGKGTGLLRGPCRSTPVHDAERRCGRYFHASGDRSVPSFGHPRSRSRWCGCVPGCSTTSATCA